MTSTTVRTYTVGDIAEPADYAGGVHQPGVCNFRIVDAPEAAGYGYCSMLGGHTGPQHVAAYSTGAVCHVWDRDTSGDPIVEQPTREVLQERLDVTGAEVVRLRREVGELTARLAMRDDELTRARAERDELRTEHDEFRAEVGRVAMRYARAHDWCSVVQSALSELGITVTQRWRIRTDVYASAGDWEAKREGVYVTVESERDQRNVYQDVDALDGDDAIEALEAAGVYLPEGMEFSRFDASTSDVELVED